MWVRKEMKPQNRRLLGKFVCAGVGKDNDFQPWLMLESPRELLKNISVPDLSFCSTLQQSVFILSMPVFLETVSFMRTETSSIWILQCLVPAQSPQKF